MKKIFLISAIMISSSNSISNTTIILDKSDIVSIETTNREIVNVKDISKKFSGITVSGNQVKINDKDKVINIELKNGEVNTIDSLINDNLIKAATGGQDGGGG